MPRLNHKLVNTNKPYLTWNNHSTTNSFNGSISRSTRLSRHQISQKYTSPTVYTFIITMRLLSSYQFPPVGSGGQFSPSVWPHNPATRFRPTSATVVSAEPFPHGTGTLRCLQKEMATYRHWSVSLWRDPDDVSHCRSLFPDKTEWRLISATLCRWGRCFVADQLW